MKLVIGIKGGHKLTVKEEDFLYTDGSPLTDALGGFRKRLENGGVFVNEQEVAWIYATPDEDDPMWD